MSDAATRFIEGASLRTGGASPRRFEIESVRPHQGDYLLALVGVASRTDAEQLIGTQFVIGLEDRRELESDEWWEEDLIGCSVVSIDGLALGEVAGVETGSAQDRGQNGPFNRGFRGDQGRTAIGAWQRILL